MSPRLWQRQPGETPADFTAFAAYLRLKGRRSHRAAAEATGRSLGAIRRLSARNNWTGRVAAFETRLAAVTQDAVDGVFHAAASASGSDFEKVRIQELLLAQQVIHASHRWLKLASNPRRHQMSLTQICRLTELAFKLKCLATGMPFGDEPRRRSRPAERSGYWTGPSFEVALQKIYGEPLPEESTPAALAEIGVPASSESSRLPSPVPANSPSSAVPSSGSNSGLPSPVSGLISAAPEPPPPERNDAWSRLRRQMYP